MTDFKPCRGPQAQVWHRLRHVRLTTISLKDAIHPKWPDGKKHARNVYAHTREECEEKLKALIIEMKTELAELKRQKAEGTLPPQAPEGKKGPKKTKENK